jgi:peptide/nickel transport system ATP-binding protein
MTAALDRFASIPFHSPASDKVLDVSRLNVSFGRGAEAVPVVHDVSFSLNRGECIAIVGESGSGKSVTARTLIGLAGNRASISAEALSFGDRDLRKLTDREWRKVRGRQIGFVLQDALVSLDPVRSVGKEVAEALRIHSPDLKSHQVEERVIALLQRVGIPDPAIRARQLPGELSGGLRQRALIATAVACNPDLLIADEPTTALDVTIQAQILDLFESFKAERKSLLVISHDLAVVSRLADRIIVMNRGRIVEEGSREQVLFDPRDAYTKLLISAIPGGKPKGVRLSPGNAGIVPLPVEKVAPGEVVGRVQEVSKAFRAPDGGARPAVIDVSFELRAGETLGVVGESGSGKTTTSRILLGLANPDKGNVEIGGRNWSSLSGAERLEFRRGIQVIYQDTLSSFDPRYTVGDTLEEAIGVAGIEKGPARRKRALELLDAVGLSSTHLKRRPIELSGGQRQRVAIARALAPSPKIIVCDEPVSALDVSIQAQVLDLLADLQRETGISYLFISHDLSVISHVSDRVIVMKDGRIVEEGDTSAIFDHPSHPYTRELISAIPSIEQREKTRKHS